MTSNIQADISDLMPVDRSDPTPGRARSRMLSFDQCTADVSAALRSHCFGEPMRRKVGSEITLDPWKATLSLLCGRRYDDQSEIRGKR